MQSLNEDSSSKDSIEDKANITQLLEGYLSLHEINEIELDKKYPFINKNVLQNSEEENKAINNLNSLDLAVKEIDNVTRKAFPLYF